jgi:hypothetical protein
VQTGYILVITKVLNVMETFAMILNDWESPTVDVSRYLNLLTICLNAHTIMEQVVY